jgi:hypothetical protein
MTPVGVKALPDRRVFDSLAKRQYNRHIQKQKEPKMSNIRPDTLRVADLIRILSTVDPTLPVYMSMNMEYGMEVSSAEVGVETYSGVDYLVISDTLGA